MESNSLGGCRRKNKYTTEVFRTRRLIYLPPTAGSYPWHGNIFSRRPYYRSSVIYVRAWQLNGRVNRSCPCKLRFHLSLGGRWDNKLWWVDVNGDGRCSGRLTASPGDCVLSKKMLAMYNGSSFRTCENQAGLVVDQLIHSYACYLLTITDYLSSPLVRNDYYWPSHSWGLQWCTWLRIF